MPFISFSLLSATSRTSNAVLNRSDESGRTCFLPDFRGKVFSFSPLSMMLAVGLSYMAFIMLRYVPSMPAFWRVFFFFYHKWMLNFVRGFLCICWDNHMVFIFQFVKVVYHIDLQILKNPYILGMKPTWSWCMIFLICCWILFARILLRIFTAMFISDIGLQFSFFVASLSGFGISVMLAS